MWTIGLRAKSHRKFDEAISWYTRALEMQEGLLGGNNLDVARTLNSIGNCYQAMQRLSDARSSFERALGIQEAAGEHALAAETLVNLGALAEISGDHVSAEAHYRRALSIQESHLGDHHDTAATLSNIGCMYQALRKLDEAEGVLKRAVDILQRLSRSSTDKTLLKWVIVRQPAAFGVYSSC
jgi:tetratricopeptide (TPR) repeat protein